MFSFTRDGARSCCRRRCRCCSRRGCGCDSRWPRWRSGWSRCWGYSRCRHRGCRALSARRACDHRGTCSCARTQLRIECSRDDRLRGHSSLTRSRSGMAELRKSPVRVMRAGPFCGYAPRSLGIANSGKPSARQDLWVHGLNERSKTRVADGSGLG